jgi:hypothetical protein
VEEKIEINLTLKNSNKGVEKLENDKTQLTKNQKKRLRKKKKKQEKKLLLLKQDEKNELEHEGVVSEPKIDEKTEINALPIHSEQPNKYSKIKFDKFL